MTIEDLDGKTITVTDLSEAISQAKYYSCYSDQNSKVHKYWKHLLEQLLKIEEPVIVKPIIDESLPFHVVETRKIFGNTYDFKMFIKNDKHQPLYSIHSCARSSMILNQIDNLSIGESTHNSNNTKITRIY